MRARLGPASRAAMQFGTTWIRRDIGTLPFTAPMSGVGRLAGKIGLTSARATVVPLTPITNAMLVASAARRPERMRIPRIQSGSCVPATHTRRPEDGAYAVDSLVIEDHGEIAA